MFKRELIKTINIVCPKNAKDRIDICFFNTGEVYTESWDNNTSNHAIEVKIPPRQYEEIITALMQAHSAAKKHLWRLEK